jgi:hypothetical protein
MIDIDSADSHRKHFPFLYSSCGFSHHIVSYWRCIIEKLDARRVLKSFDLDGWILHKYPIFREVGGGDLIVRDREGEWMQKGDWRLWRERLCMVVLRQTATAEELAEYGL